MAPAGAEMDAHHTTLANYQSTAAAESFRRQQTKHKSRPDFTSRTGFLIVILFYYD